MDIEKEIEDLLLEIKQIKDPLFIKAIKSMLVYHKKVMEPEWWERLTEEEKQKILYG